MKWSEMKLPNYPSLRVKAWASHWPAWAPQDLLKHHAYLIEALKKKAEADQKYIVFLPTAARASLLQTMLIDSRMERVWDSIERWGVDLNARRRQVLAARAGESVNTFHYLKTSPGLDVFWAAVNI